MTADERITAADLRWVLGGSHPSCEGIVTRDGEQDACGKPIVAIIDGRATEDETFWPACTYHAHRYGGGRVVPLLDVLTAAAGQWDAP